MESIRWKDPRNRRLWLRELTPARRFWHGFGPQIISAFLLTLVLIVVGMLKADGPPAPGSGWRLLLPGLAFFALMSLIYVAANSMSPRIELRARAIIRQTALGVTRWEYREFPFYSIQSFDLGDAWIRVLQFRQPSGHTVEFELADTVDDDRLARFLEGRVVEESAS